MKERWLRTNQRLLGLGLFVPALALAIAAGTATWAVLTQRGWPLLAASGAIGLPSLIAIAALLRFLRTPVLALDDGYLIVALSRGAAERVPIEIVECFFRGQGETPVAGKSEGVSSAHIVVRLAEAAQTWHHREVEAKWGRWCGGYITIYGTWCEPITADLLRSLNAKLTAAHRARRETQTPGTACHDSSACERS